MPALITDPTTLGLLTAGLEKAIEAALQYDPGTRVALGELAGKILAFESTFPAVTLYVCPQPSDSKPAVVLQAFIEGEPQTRVRGSLPAMLGLLGGERRSLAGTGVEVFGDSGLLARFQDILQDVDIDWEEPVTAVLGTSLGHPFAQLLRRQFSWASASASKSRQFASEYLTEELRAIPAPEALDAFYEDVDDLRSATDRLAARIEQLTQHFNSHGEDRA